MIKKKETPLSGKRIVVTRSQSQSGELTNRLEDLGAQVIALPLIEINPFCDPDALEEIFDELGTYEWIAFTSMNGVRYFFDFFFKKFEDIRSIGGVNIACVGPKTAQEVQKYHLGIDLIPSGQYCAKTLGQALIEHESIDNEKILLVQGNLNRDTLLNLLENEGRAIVDRLQVYETKTASIAGTPQAQDFCQNGAHAIIFTSSSALDSFMEQSKDLQLNPNVTNPIAFSMGGQTTERLLELGVPLGGQSEDHSLQGLLDTIVAKLG